jgi:hypothetical protein
MSDAFAAMVAQSPDLAGEKFERLRALRESGYSGPVDQAGAIPDPEPSSPMGRQALDILAALNQAG